MRTLLEDVENVRRAKMYEGMGSAAQEVQQAVKVTYEKIKMKRRFEANRKVGKHDKMLSMCSSCPPVSCSSRLLSLSHHTQHKCMRLSHVQTACFTLTPHPKHPLLAGGC